MRALNTSRKVILLFALAAILVTAAVFILVRQEGEVITPLLTGLGGIFLMAAVAVTWNQSLKRQVQRRTAALSRELVERVRAESHRDAMLEALQEARDELERRVEERTEELAQSNAALRVEIAERVRAESQRDAMLEALQKSEKNLIKAQEIVHLGSWEWDVPEDEINWSDEVYRIYGIEPGAKPTNEAVYELIHPDDKAIFDQAMAGLLTGQAPSALDYRIVRTDGQVRFVHIKADMSYDKSGNLLQVLGTVQDITERMRVEEALRESEKRFRSIIDSTQAGYFFIDRDGLWQHVNDAWLRMHGYDSTDNVIGQHFALTQVEVDFKEAQKNVEMLLAGAPIPTGEFSRRCKDGSIGYHTFSANPVVQAGQVVGLEGFIIDVTENKQAEEQIKASLREKEVLLQEIHHRVKNNLAIVSSLLQLQAEITPGEGARAAFQESRNRIQAMARIHEHLYRSLDMARIDMAQYVRGVVKHLRQSFGTHTVALQVDAADVALDIDQATPCGLIINELVSNAFKHAFPPSWQGPENAKVCVALRIDDGQCMLTVSDNGVGLPPDLQMESVGHESLGLRLVNLLSRQLEGSLQVDRKEGSTFRLAFAISAERSEDDSK